MNGLEAAARASDSVQRFVERRVVYSLFRMEIVSGSGDQESRQGNRDVYETGLQ